MNIIITVGSIAMMQVSASGIQTRTQAGAAQEARQITLGATPGETYKLEAITGLTVKATSEEVQMRSVHGFAGLNGEDLAFRSPVHVRLRRGDMGWEGSIPSFNILEFGDSIEACMAAVAAGLSFMWREYAMESDDALDSEAQNLAARLRGVVKRPDHAEACE